MGDATGHETKLTRAETAEFLRSIADELDTDKDRIRIAIGNKRVRLSPPERIATETAVTERSRRLRKDVEELELRFNWTPTKATAEAAADGDTSETASQSDFAGWRSRLSSARSSTTSRWALSWPRRLTGHPGATRRHRPDVLDGRGSARCMAFAAVGGLLLRAYIHRREGGLRLDKRVRRGRPGETDTVGCTYVEI